MRKVALTLALAAAGAAGAWADGVVYLDDPAALPGPEGLSHLLDREPCRTPPTPVRLP